MASVRRAHNIDDLREMARRSLPRGLFEFIDRGTEDEISLKANRSDFDSIRFTPRVLVDVSQRNQTCRFFGKSSRMPVAVAPTGAAGLLHFDGEIALARAAAQAGIPFTLSTASIVSMERVAAEGGGGTLWFQLYMWPEREMSYRLVERVRAAGYEALIVTVDTAVAPNREYNRRNGFTIPMRIGYRNFLDVARRPSWFFKVWAKYLLRAGVPVFENYPEEFRQKMSATPGKTYTAPKNDSLVWNDLRELRKRWDGPLLLKGVLHPSDAISAIQCGVDGIIVSNHGARNLDSAITAIRALPSIVEHVNDRAQVFLDSGVRRGGDVVKALMLGATGVLVGRAPLWGVAAGGQQGALHALNIFHEEISRVMGFLGCPSIDALRHAETPVCQTDDLPV